jgi:hypothetical protein
VEPFDGVAERRQLVAAASLDLRRVKDSLGLVSSQGDRVGGVLDQPELDRVGDGPSSYGSFGARFVRRYRPIRTEKRRAGGAFVRFPEELSLPTTSRRSFVLLALRTRRCLDRPTGTRRRHQ